MSPRPGTLRAAIACLIRGHHPRKAEGVLFQRGAGPWAAIWHCTRCGREMPEQHTVKGVPR